FDNKPDVKLTSTQANFNGTLPYNGAAAGPHLGRTARVGSYRPNAIGLYDMHGNVWEWVEDWFDAGYYKVSPKLDAPGPARTTSRGMRGGGWLHDGEYCRAANRSPHGDERTNYLGLRVATSAGR